MGKTENGKDRPHLLAEKRTNLSDQLKSDPRQCEQQNNDVEPEI
jgi:hypothetical protein